MSGFMAVDWLYVWLTLPTVLRCGLLLLDDFMLDSVGAAGRQRANATG